MKNIIAMLLVVIMTVYSIPCYAESYSEKNQLRKLPQDYSLYLAIKNGDVVMGNDGAYNVDKLEKFMNHLSSSKPDLLRVVMYTDEGDAIIHYLFVYNKNIILFVDTTRDKFGSPSLNQYKVISIYKDELDNGTAYFAKLNDGEYPLVFVAK